MKQAYFNWSSGKDSALALHKALLSGKYNIHTLFTVVNGSEDCVSLHKVSAELLERQAYSIGIPLFLMRTESDESIKEYKVRMERHLGRMKAQGVDTALFGDIYLDEVRSMREKNFENTGVTAEFPLWNMNAAEIMREFIDEGFKAVITSVDCSVLDDRLLGRVIDRDFIRNFPIGADLCGENGEYHSFVFDGPIFRSPVRFSTGDRYYIDYTDDRTGKKSRYGYIEIY